MYWYHADQINTPTQLTDLNRQVVWDALREPFGKTEVATNNATNNLRFPGQYEDSETGLNYNYFRDYDPATGRYVESDPIGLHGGRNLYSYAGDEPNFYVDPYGLKVLNPQGFPLSPEVEKALWEFNRLIGCDKDIVVTGGNRPKDSKLGAGANSPHVRGIAADIAVPGQSHLETANQASQSGLFGGVGWYEEGYRGPNGEGPHTHVDLRDDGPARWGHPASGETMHGEFPAYNVQLHPENCGCEK